LPRLTAAQFGTHKAHNTHRYRSVSCRNAKRAKQSQFRAGQVDAKQNSEKQLQSFSGHRTGVKQTQFEERIELETGQSGGMRREKKL